MAISSRLIKRRIRSVANTRKITKAMELVAASKMRKAVHLALSSRAYSGTAADIVDNVRKLVDPQSHPLFNARKDAVNTLVVVAASDRGLCGGFNSQILKKALEFLRRRSEKNLRLVTVGKRAESAIKRAGYQIIAAFEAASETTSFEMTRPVGDFVYNEFIRGLVDRVFLIYTDFKSAIVQIPTASQLLPLTPENELPTTAYPDDPSILFEPDPREVLDRLLPRLLETRIYQALLDSGASEHSARMMAMRNATENATEMLQDLTLTFNQARQAAITREISEISAGKAALE